MVQKSNNSVYNYKQYLLFLLPFFMATTCIFSCSNKEKPTRKEGDKCAISLKDANKNLFLYDTEKFFQKEIAINQTYKTHIILEDPDYQIAISDIHVRIGGKLFDDSWSFAFQTNYRNILTINADYVVNDIEIEVTPSRRTSSRKIFGYARDILVNQGIDRNCYTFFKYDENGKPVQIDTPPDTPPSYEIPGAFSFLEDEPINVRLGTSLTPHPISIPNNVWVRSNSRFLLKCPDDYVGDDLSWQFEYDFRVIRENEREVFIHIAKYLVRDHGSFRLNPNVPEGI